MSQSGVDAAKVCQGLGGRGLPNLWLPRERDFFQIAEVPTLGPVKVDLKKCKELALEKANA